MFFLICICANKNPCLPLTMIQFSFSFSSRWHCSARKVHTLSTPSVCSFPKVGLETVVEHRSFSTLEGGMPAASFLRSFFLQAISAVMFWPVHVQKVPQASEHLCSAKLQTRCGICCACQCMCLFFPADYSVPRTVDLQKSL